MRYAAPEHNSAIQSLLASAPEHCDDDCNVGFTFAFVASASVGSCTTAQPQSERHMGERLNRLVDFGLVYTIYRDVSLRFVPCLRAATPTVVPLHIWVCVQCWNWRNEESDVLSVRCCAPASISWYRVRHHTN